MTYWLIVAIVIAVVFFALLRLGIRPYRNKVRLDDFGWDLRILLDRGLPDGFLVAEIPSPGKDCLFVQFAKYLTPDGIAGIEFGFPLAPWSEGYYPVLKEALRRESVDFEIESTWRGDTKEFLTVNVGKDIELAIRLSTIVIRDVFGLNHDVTLHVLYHNVSPREEKIGR